MPSYPFPPVNASQLSVSALSNIYSSLEHTETSRWTSQQQQSALMISHISTLPSQQQQAMMRS